jgi:hypothetical protein
MLCEERPMRRIGPWQVLITILLVGLGVTACGDLPTSPEASDTQLTRLAPSFAVVEGWTLGALRWKHPLSSDFTRRKVMDRKGGRIHTGRIGVTLEVPKGAIRGRKVEISMTVLAGDGIAVSFAPHGLKFKHPVRLIIDLSKTEEAGALTPGQPVAIYFEGESTSTVQGLEVLPVEIKRGKLVVEIHHFSGYLLAGG